MRLKDVYTKRIAVELVRQGFPVVKVKENPKNPKLWVWVFEDTPAFQLAFANIANSK